MLYEFKVSDLADEFGVHRNTIRNWISAGTLPAQKAPGRKYSIKWKEYNALCEKFGRQPKVWPETENDIPPVEKVESHSPDLAPVALGSLSRELYDDPSYADTCLACGSCASACPITGVDGLDPRKIIRMAFLGLGEELLTSDWMWKCTLCAKCEEACPMDMNIVGLIYGLRARCDRDKVPDGLQRGVVTCLERGNNMGIPKEDFLELLTEIGNELAEESCPGFKVPIDMRGARLLMTVNSKDPFAEPDNLKFLWKILHAAGETWTIPADNWEGVNWGFFSGDDKAMKTIVSRIVDNARRLNCQTILLPECGHAYYATRMGLEKWYPEVLEEFEIFSVLDLLVEYIEAGKIKLDGTRQKKITTYQDPCNYGRKSLDAFGVGYFEEGRLITKTCCQDFVEMTPNRYGNYCCGAGGGLWTTQYSAERVFYGRVKARQIKETGAKIVITPCHTCRDQINESLNHEFDLGIEVKYLWEIVSDALVAPGK